MRKYICTTIQTFSSIIEYLSQKFTRNFRQIITFNPNCSIIPRSLYNLIFNTFFLLITYFLGWSSVNSVSLCAFLLYSK